MNKWKLYIKHRRILNKSYLWAGLLIIIVFIVSYHSYLNISNVGEDIESYLGWLFSFKDFSWIQTVALSLFDFIRYDFNVIQLYAITSTALLIIALTLIFTAIHQRSFQTRHNMIMKQKEPENYIESLQQMTTTLHNPAVEKKLQHLHQLFMNDIEFGICSAKICSKENEIAEKLKEVAILLDQCFDFEKFDCLIRVIEQLMNERSN